MAKTYRIQVTDGEMKALKWKHVDPHQAIDDLVTARIHEAMEEIANDEIKTRLANPQWNKPIPANKLDVLDDLVLVSARDHMYRDAARMEAFVREPDNAAIVANIASSRISKSSLE